jgi:hypothetical protein
MIVMPQLVESDQSMLEPLAKSSIYEAMVPTAASMTVPSAVRRECHALSMLIQQTDCYRLKFGRDIQALPKLIAPLLELRKSA